MKTTESESGGKDTFLIDSYGWIEYFAEGKLAQKYAKYIEKADQQNYISPTIVLYEVYKKIQSTYNEDMAIEAAAYIKYVTKLVNLTDNLAIFAAETSLKEKLPMADAIILTTALKYKAKVITSDDHFRGFNSVIFI
jgi:predicted nucleic acid-binding protein